MESEGWLRTQGRTGGVPRLRNIAVFSPRCVELEPLPDMCLQFLVWSASVLSNGAFFDLPAERVSHFRMLAFD